MVEVQALILGSGGRDRPSLWVSLVYIASFRPANAKQTLSIIKLQNNKNTLKRRVPT